jgi:folylpolyglutamate synthase/dihydropteroate synthase
LYPVTWPTPIIEAENVHSALVSARECVGGTGRVLVFGSFYTVSAVLQAMK